MKVMDISMQDENCIELGTPAKKKKMKQAQLPFQMLSSLSSPNGITKKRKLTSPSIEHKSPKVVKYVEDHTIKNSQNEKLENDEKSAVNESNETVEIQDIENKPLGQSTSEKSKSPNNLNTPKRSSIGRGRKSETKTTPKSSALTKFLKKTDNEETVTKENDRNSSPQEEKAGEISEKKNESLLMDTSSDKAENNSDAEVEVLSSDTKEKHEEQVESNTTEETINTEYPITPKIRRSKINAESPKQKKLTPKQQEKKLLSAKKKEEKQRLRMEKEKKLEEEREIRRKEKEEKRREKEEKEKEKRLNQQKKQLENEQKQKEKEAKEEEKRKKEEEKLESERKKQKAASNFASFFVAKKQETKSLQEENEVKVKNFMPFEVKADMRIAPVCRRVLTEQDKLALDEKCNGADNKKSDLYLGEIKSKNFVARTATKTWPTEAKDDVVLLDEESEGMSNIVNQNPTIEKQRPKLLLFNENRRPPYWGTWRKKSRSVSSRRPFAKDTQWFNYEVDSDEEWEEEEPGESLHGSDDEKEDDTTADNEYDVDNEFMVPHGYLSDEEMRADEKDNEDMSPETQKFKLKLLGEQFESERNTKTSKLQPKIIGCIWQGPENKFASSVPEKVVNFLKEREVWVREIPVVLSTVMETETTETGESETVPHQPSTQGSKMSKVPREALPDFIRLIHGNTHSRKFLVKEFLAYWCKKENLGENQISKASLSRKLGEIGKRMACPEEGPMHLTWCWYVAEETRKKYKLDELSLPNRWTYTLTPKRKSDVHEVEKLEKEEVVKEKKSVPLITQFTKKISQEEMKKQLSTDSPKISVKGSGMKAPKRATLISVARGEQFTESSKESLLKRPREVDKRKENGVATCKSNRLSDEVVVIESSEDEAKEK